MPTKTKTEKRAVQRLRFTKKFLEALRCERGRDRQYLFDSQTPRLALCVTETGAKSFYVIRRVHGRPKRIRLGGFPELSIEQARERAEETNSEVTRGIDPSAAKRARRGEATLAELFQHWIENHAKPRKKTWREDVQKFDLHLKHLANRRLSEITRKDVATLHVRLAKRRNHPGSVKGYGKRQIGGPGAANRLLGFIRALFNKAVDLGFTGPNPARGIQKFRETQRERFLHADEIPKFFEALREELNETARDFFWLALYTGARRSNVQAMAWQQINLERGTWEIPDTKSGKPQTVYLPEPAREILRARKQAAEAEAEQKEKTMSAWVLPGTGKTGHLKEPKKAWKRIVTRAGLRDVRIHDLRRTLGSWQAATGASLPVIGKSLGHRQQSTTQIYARLDLDPVRESVDRATAAIRAAAEARAE